MRMRSKIMKVALGILVGLWSCVAVAEYSVTEHQAAMPGFNEVAQYVLHTPDVQMEGHQQRVVVYLYGRGGSMRKPNFVRPEFKEMRAELCRRGYAVVVPELGPLHFMDATAVKKVDAVLADLSRNPRFDVSRVFLFGTSMGGGAALAYTLQRPDRVAAIVDQFGITDYAQWAGETSKFRDELTKSFGGLPQQAPEEYRKRSGLSNVDELLSHRIYFIHGDSDPLVDVSYSERLHKALTARRGKSKLTVIRGGTHDNATIMGLEDEVADFFDEDSAVDPTALTAEELSKRFELRKTKSGQRYAILGPAPTAPAPTLFVLSGSAEQSLTDTYFLQCGKQLLRDGVLCVSLDLPCHGQEVRTGEREGLPGWNARVNAGQPLVEDFCRQFQQVLSELVEAKLADPKRIAVCGTSRGGFMAFHAAAHEPQVSAVIGMAPVASLLALDEFADSRAADDADALSLRHLVPQLANRRCWIAIGDRDERVDTDEAIRFARLLSADAVNRGLSSRVDMLVLGESRGHSLPPGTDRLATEWLRRLFNIPATPSADLAR
jgi:dienelactone hydrolase